MHEAAFPHGPHRAAQAKVEQMALSLLGTKVGMTRVYEASGAIVPVTVLRVGPCIVTQIRTVEKDGYSAVQIGYGDMKPRNSTIPLIAHDAKAGTGPKRRHAEFRCTPEEGGQFEVGQTLTAKELDDTMFVDLTSTSKGKGFAGVMKRYHFKGLCQSHGTERKHRSPGSIGGHASNRGFGGGLKKGKRMPGHMGAERVTTRSSKVVRIDHENGLVLVKGSVPGPNGATVMLRKAVRLNRSKAKQLAEGVKS
jgi:large subunit ribosomal protein L3